MEDALGPQDAITAAGVQLSESDLRLPIDLTTVVLQDRICRGLSRPAGWPEAAGHHRWSS